MHASTKALLALSGVSQLCAVLVNHPGSLVARVPAEPGDRGFALCLYGGFEANAVHINYVSELVRREGRDL